VRKDQKPGDYSDPGWYAHPPGTVAYEWTGALPEPAREPMTAAPAPGASAAGAGATPKSDIEVRVRKPQGSGGHAH